MKHSDIFEVTLEQFVTCCENFTSKSYAKLVLRTLINKFIKQYKCLKFIHINDSDIKNIVSVSDEFNYAKEEDINNSLKDILYLIFTALGSRKEQFVNNLKKNLGPTMITLLNKRGIKL